MWLPDAVGEGDNDGSKSLVVASTPAQKVEDVSTVCGITVLLEGEMPVDADTATTVGSIDAGAGSNDTRET